MPIDEPVDRTRFLAWRPLQRSTRLAILIALLATASYQMFLLDPSHRGNTWLWAAVITAELITAVAALAIDPRGPAGPGVEHHLASEPGVAERDKGGGGLGQVGLGELDKPQLTATLVAKRGRRSSQGIANSCFVSDYPQRLTRTSRWQRL